jgi:hypothetical protein
MYLRWLFYFSAVLSIVYGLGFLIVPDAVASAYSSKLDATATAIARYWATTLVGLAWVSWTAATTSGSPLKLTLTRALEIVGILGIVVTWLALQAGAISTTGAILNFVIAAIYTIGFGYYGWAKKDAALA